MSIKEGGNCLLYAGKSMEACETALAASEGFPDDLWWIPGESG